MGCHFRLFFVVTVVSIIASLCIATALAEADADQECSQTSVVLVGANGDLAKRYLWPAIFSLFQKWSFASTGDRLVIVAGTRKSLSRKELSDLVGPSVKCEENDRVCRKAKKHFLEEVLSEKLKTSADYSVLDERLKKEALRHSCDEAGRLFYLSIPPFAFASVSEWISAQCRVADAWLRVVFEKPFGNDIQSAVLLSNSLKKHLRENEILRTDHYLGKTTVSAMMDLRRSLEAQDSELWNHRHISSVDIVVKETLDVAGRTGYYSQYGVIRDMLQNHLTELLVLVAMDTELGRSGKQDVLEQVKAPNARSVLLGQYESFNDHLRQEEKDTMTSHTPTFASAVLWLAGKRWRGVPFRLTSGKVMDQRTAYVSVSLRQQHGTSPGCEKKIVFHIQGGECDGPCFVVSEGVLKQLPSLPDGWTWDSSVDSVDGCPVHVARPDEVADPYSVIVSAAVQGNAEMFVGTPSLLASWRIWSPVLRSEPYLPLRTYNKDLVLAGYLDTVVSGEHIRFSIEQDSLASPREFDPYPSQTAGTWLGLFAGSRLFTGHLPNVVKKLAEEVLAQALEAVAERGAFHLALPGGSSPLPLFQELAFDNAFENFPWQYTHIWQTDERCVSDSSDGGLSNFVQLSAALLEHVSIPAYHVHRMPVRLAHGLCNETDSGWSVYEAEMESWNATKLDLVVLGVGTDGHVASLFPGSSKEMDASVTSVCRPGIDRNKAGACRMTVTHKALFHARNLVLFVRGQAKRAIVQEMKTASASDSSLPALQVAKEDVEKTTWYIDDEAFG